MKKKIALALATVMISGLLSGCANSENEQLRKKIEKLEQEIEEMNGERTEETEEREDDYDSSQETSKSDKSHSSSDNDFEELVSKGLISMNVGEITDCAESISGGIVLPDYVSQINSYSFAMCDRLNSISIPGSVDTIGICAFQNCTELTSVSMGDGVETIAESAFCQCIKLSDLKIADTVKSIHNTAFYMCNGVTSVDLPNVRYIGDHAFACCESLSEVNIGDNISTIGKGVFDECTALTKATYKGKTYSYANIDELYDAINNPDSAPADNTSSNDVSIMIDPDGRVYWTAHPDAVSYIVKVESGSYYAQDECTSNDSVNYTYYMSENGFPQGSYTLDVYGVKRNGDEFYIASLDFYYYG